MQMFGSTSLLQQGGLAHVVQQEKPHEGTGTQQQQLYLDKAQPPPRAAWEWCPQPLPLLHWHSAPQPSLQQLCVNPLNFPLLPREEVRQVGMSSEWLGWLQWGATSPIFPTAPVPEWPIQETNDSGGAPLAPAAQLLASFLYFIILWDVTVADVPGWWEQAGTAFLAPGQPWVRQDKAPLY